MIDADFFVTWPGLTSELVWKYLDKSDSTVKGHLRNAQSNVQPIIEKQDITEMMSALQHEKVTGREKESFAKFMVLSENLYSNKTRIFPHSSIKGNKYIMVMYDIDPNAI